MKTLKRLILAAIAVVLLLGLGIYIAVKVAMPPAKIRALISAKGSEALGRKVEVGDISVRLLPHLKLTISEINVANAPGFSADPVIKLREVNLSLNLLSLLRFSPVIRQIKIVSPEILYEVDAYGHNNLEGLGKKDAAVQSPPAPQGGKGVVEIPAALALKSFVILDGKVRYRDAKSGRELVLGRINQDVSLALDPRLRNVISAGKLEITQVSVRDSASGLRKGDVRIAVTHDVALDLPGERLQLKKVELSFQDIKAQVEGSLAKFMSAPEADLRVSAPAISLASVLKEVPASLSPEIPKLKAEGQASFRAHFRGKLDTASTPEIDGELSIRGGGLRHADIPQGVEHLEVDASLRHDSLRLAKLSFDMGRNPVRVEALVTDAQKIPYLVRLAVDAALDLGGLAALAQKMGFLDAKIAVAGTETIKLQASGPLDPRNPHKLSASGTVELRGVSLALPGKPRLRADGKVQITNDRIREQLAVKVGESDVAVTAEISNYLAMVLPKLARGGRARARVEVKSGFLDLDALLPPPAKTGDKKSAPPMKTYPPLPPVDADVTMNLARTRLMGLEMTNFQSQTELRASGMTTKLKGSVYSGSFSSDAKLVPRGATDMGVALKLNAVRVEANDFISRLNDRVPLSNRLFQSLAGADSLIFGKLNLNMDVATHGLPQDFAKNLTGAVLVALADGKLRQSDLTQGFSGALSKVNSSLGFNHLAFGGLKADVTVENGKLVVRNFSLDQSAIGALLASGDIGFDNALNLQLTQALPPAASKLVGGAGVGGVSLVPTDKSGRALLYFAVGGLLNKPNFSLDAKRMAQEGAAGALGRKQEEFKSKALAEKQRLEAEARAKLEAEKKKLQDQAASEAKKQGKKVLKSLGF